MMLHSRSESAAQAPTARIHIAGRNRQTMISHPDIFTGPPLMIPTKPSTPVTPGKKILLQLLAFLALAVLFYLRPKIEAWVEAQKVPANAAPTTVEPTGSDDAFAQSPPPAASEERPAAERPAPEQPAQELTEPSKKNTAATKTKKEKSAPTSPVDREEDYVAAGGVKPPKSRGSDLKSAEVSPKSSELSPASNAPKTAETPKKKSSVVRMDRDQPAPRRIPDDAEKSLPPPGEPKSSPTQATTDPQLGKLKELRDNVFESSAGLIYLPGSADGHRLRHVMKHAKDDPRKEIHGVFDGDRDQILATIDEAFVKTKKGGSDVRSEKQNGRRIYTVNLRRRIGQMGGRQGDRQGNPECRYLRIVLEDEHEVVTAYPTRSF